MKGRIAIYVLIALAIVVITIAVALGPLRYLFDIDPFFLNPAKGKLIKYATCSLALCSNGVDTKQVDSVGCLERERGKCVKSCRQVQEEFLATKTATFKDVSGRYHFCGEGNALEFEFDTSFPIDLRSEEIQKRSRPSWVCSGFKMPFTESRVPFSDDWQNLNGDCIEFGTIAGSPSLIPPGGTEEDLENSIGEQCFDGFRHTVFTPLMPYKQQSDRIYPSALYLGEEFTSGEKPECEISTGGPVLTGIPTDFSFLLNPEGDSKSFDTISKCNIKPAGKKFKVWSEVAINKPYLNWLPDILVGRIALKDYAPDFLKEFAKTLDEYEKNFAEEVRKNFKATYSKINTCALVVLKREGGMKGGQQTTVPESLTISSDKQIYEKGETVGFMGTLRLDSGSPEDKIIRLELTKKFETLGTAIIDSASVTTDKDGNFAWEFTLSKNTASGPYAVTAKYEAIRSIHEFEVK